MTDQELRLKAVAEGFDQAAAEVGKVTAAQQGAAEATGEQSKATGGLNQTTDEFIGELNKLHPLLGESASRFLRLTNFASDLAGKQINLKSITEQVSTAFGKLGGNFTALLGTGALLAAAFYGIQKALKAMREEWERVTKAIQDQQTAMNALVRSREQDAQSIEDLRNASKAGPFSPEQARCYGFGGIGSSRRQSHRIGRSHNGRQ